MLEQSKAWPWPCFLLIYGGLVCDYTMIAFKAIKEQVFLGRLRCNPDNLPSSKSSPSAVFITVE